MPYDNDSLNDNSVKTYPLHLGFLLKKESELYFSFLQSRTERLCECPHTFPLSFFFSPFSTTLRKHVAKVLLCFLISQRRFPIKKGVYYVAHRGKKNYKCLCFALVIVFWLKWAGYLAVIGLNLLAQSSDRMHHFTALISVHDGKLYQKGQWQQVIHRKMMYPVR